MNARLSQSIQDAQSVIGKAQRAYRDTQVQFWALGLAWEAVRLAWYEVADGNNGGKIANVENALNDYKRVAEMKKTIR